MPIHDHEPSFRGKAFLWGGIALGALFLAGLLTHGFGLFSGPGKTEGAPALMVRAKVVREKSGDRILPALYDDNYVALMPGERRTIHAELNNADTRGETPRVVVEGFNIRQ